MTIEVINEVTNITVTQSPTINVDVSTPGIQGPIGLSNVLTIGTVSQLAPNEAPTVTIGGVSPAQTISFGIPAGAQILRGTTAPAGALGQVGFWYINTSTWDVYEKTATSTWTSRGNIKGATGDTGPAPNLTIGTVANATPGATATATITGTNPNYVLNMNIPIANWTIGSTSSLNPGSAATVTIGGTALNPTLSIGVPRGAAFLTGTTAPETGTGNIGDWYLDNVTWNIYEKTAAAVWTLRGNIKGATGATGNTGPANSLSIGTVTTGAVGSSASATITGTAPTQTLNLTLPTGATGPTGPAPNMSIGTVTTLAAGASATATVTGTNPNYSLDLGLPQGLKGDVGAQWYAGTGAPSGATGVIGDFYLVTGVSGTGDVYKKTGASAWTLQGNIRGQAGTGDVESVNGVLPVGGNVTLTWSNFTGTIPTSALPSLATVETYTVATEAAMLALSAQRGDLAIRTDLDETYILSGNDPTVLGNWTVLLTDGGNVRLTGNQTVGGIKTFSSSPVVPDGSWAIANTSGLQDALDLKAPLANPTFTGTVSGITKAMVGLSNVTNAAQVELTGAQTIAGVKTFSSAPVVPDASFTIAKTSGLQTALDGKAAASHTHAATEIVSGTLDIARIPTGTTGTTVALGNHLHTGVYEPLIAAGTTAQYRRGDNTWQTLNSVTVDLTTAQTIAGIKTFSATPVFSSGITVNGTLTLAGGTNNNIELGSVDGTSSTPFIDFHSGATATNYDARVIAGGGDGTSGNGNLTVIARGGVAVEGKLFPNSDANRNLGDTTLRWNNVFGVNFYGSGENLTSLNGSNISSGTVPQARITLQAPEINATDNYSSTPIGVSQFGLSSSTGWPDGLGTVLSVNSNANRAFQMEVAKITNRVSIRSADSSQTNGWSAFNELVDTTNAQTIGGAKTFTTAPTISAFSANRALVTLTGGTLGVSAVTSAELGYLSGVTSAVQTQLNAKAPTASPTFTGTVSGITKAMVGLGNVDNTADSAKTFAASQVTSGTFATDRLGSGTANNTTFLRGDNTWAVVDTSVDGGTI